MESVFCIVFMILLGLQGTRVSEAPDTYLKRPASSWVMDLSHAQAKTRRAAAFALGKLGKHSLPYVNQLKSLLQSDADAGVREAAAGTLGELVSLAPTEIIGSLLASVGKENDLAVRRTLVLSIGKAGEAAAAAEPVLRQTLEQADAGLRRNAAWSLGQLGKTSSRAIDALIKALSDQETDVRSEAVAALGNLGTIASEAIGPMIKTLHDGEHQVVEQGVLALRKMGPVAVGSISSLLDIAEADKHAVSLRQSALITVETVWPTGHKENTSWNRLQGLARNAKDEMVKAAAQQAEKKIGAVRQ